MSPPQLIAEWQRNQSCWLAWPSHPDEWLGDLRAPRHAVAAFARAIAGRRDRRNADAHPHERAGMAPEAVEMLVLDRRGEDDARSMLSDVPVRYHRIPFGDIWLRDTGPVFLDCGGTLGAACFAWNGWGGKYLFSHDTQVGERIAAAAGVARVRHNYVLEGGAIDGDGQGTVLTTKECLLAENRSADGRAPSAQELERRLSEHLGAVHTIWLDRGLRNDHTDGHVDNLARFVAPGRVVCMRPSGADDPHRNILENVAATLREARDARGRRLEVIEIPSPGLVRGAPDDQVMPASYLNFYIGNQTVVVPTYAVANDRAAVAAIGALFPGRHTVGLDARAIIVGGGAFHCISKQQPALPTNVNEVRP